MLDTELQYLVFSRLGMGFALAQSLLALLPIPSFKMGIFTLCDHMLEECNCLINSYSDLEGRDCFGSQKRVYVSEQYGNC